MRLGLAHLAMSKIGKVRFTTPKVPKLTAVHIKPAINGFHVTHQFQHPHPPKQFVFQNPAKMLTHLRRIENTQWLHPTQDPARRTVSVLDLGETP